jgi:hypothetical protein
MLPSFRFEITVDRWATLAGLSQGHELKAVYVYGVWPCYWLLRFSVQIAFKLEVKGRGLWLVISAPSGRVVERNRWVSKGLILVSETRKRYHEAPDCWEGKSIKCAI